MIAAKLIELIELHAERLASDATRDLVTNVHTPGFHPIPPTDLSRRIFDILHHLGDWIGDPHDGRVQREFLEWGARRFDQSIPLSEIVYAIILLKEHLRRYIREHGLVDATFPRVEGDYILPMHLYSLQELNVTVERFWDEALYALARGYETQARLSGSRGAAV
jgi:hypothetical protein